MDRAEFHVVPNGDQWDVESNGASLTSHETQALAITGARDQAHAAEPSQVLVHGKDGQIEQEAAYGDDPSPRG